MTNDADLTGPLFFIVSGIALLVSLPLAGWLGRRDARKKQRQMSDSTRKEPTQL